MRVCVLFAEGRLIHKAQHYLKIRMDVLVSCELAGVSALLLMLQSWSTGSEATLLCANSRGGARCRVHPSVFVQVREKIVATCWSLKPEQQVDV